MQIGHAGWFVHAISCGPLQITSVVGPRRDKLDACLIFPSMPAVMKLNKLGTFSMAQLGQSKSIIGDFIKSARKVRDVLLCVAASCPLPDSILHLNLVLRLPSPST